jgi:thioredoxin-related protein
MKIAKVLILLLVMLAGGAASGPAAADKIEWHTYDSGMARSKFEKKKVFLHFYADWCGYCAEMERKTFKDPAVIAALNRNFIPIRVDSDRDKQTALLYRVKGLPDTWFISESGDVIGHRPGYIPTDQLLGILNAVTTEAAVK